MSGLQLGPVELYLEVYQEFMMNPKVHDPHKDNYKGKLLLVPLSSGDLT